MSVEQHGASPGRELEGKVVIVTGAGRGIGRAVALACAAQGARLLLNDVGCDVEGEGADPSVIEELASELRNLRAEVLTDAQDAAASGVAQALVERAVATWGQLDAVVSCAGLHVDRSVLKTDEATFERILATQLRAPFALVRAAGQVMVDRKQGGSIVLFTGPAAFFGARGQAALGAASAGVVALTRSAALELRKHRIRVNAIAPTARTRQTEDSPTFQGIQTGSMSPEHVAPIAVFLASSLAEDIHGEVVGVAGARAYAIRSRETTGGFSDGKPLSTSEVAALWREITRA